MAEQNTPQGSNPVEVTAHSNGLNTRLHLSFEHPTNIAELAALEQRLQNELGDHIITIATAAEGIADVAGNDSHQFTITASPAGPYPPIEPSALENIYNSVAQQQLMSGPTVTGLSPDKPQDMEIPEGVTAIHPNQIADHPGLEAILISFKDENGQYPPDLEVGRSPDGNYVVIENGRVHQYDPDFMPGQSQEEKQQAEAQQEQAQQEAAAQVAQQEQRAKEEEEEAKKKEAKQQEEGAGESIWKMLAQIIVAAITGKEMGDLFKQEQENTPGAPAQEQGGTTPDNAITAIQPEQAIARVQQWEQEHAPQLVQAETLGIRPESLAMAELAQEAVQNGTLTGSAAEALAGKSVTEIAQTINTGLEKELAMHEAREAVQALDTPGAESPAAADTPERDAPPPAPEHHTASHHNHEHTAPEQEAQTPPPAAPAPTPQEDMSVVASPFFQDEPPAEMALPDQPGLGDSTALAANQQPQEPAPAAPAPEPRNDTGTVAESSYFRSEPAAPQLSATEQDPFVQAMTSLYGATPANAQDMATSLQGGKHRELAREDTGGMPDSPPRATPGRGQSREEQRTAGGGL